MSVATAMSYAALIDRHVFGNGLQAVEEDQLRECYDLDSAEEFLAAIASVRQLATSDGRCPHLAAWLAEPTGPTIDGQVELGLACLLDGIAARLPQP